MLQAETKEYTRGVLARPFTQLPMKKDLPRLAKVIQVCDGEGRAIRYRPKNIPDVNPAAPAGAECLRQLLLKLTYVFEGEEEAVRLEQKIEELIAPEGVSLPEVLNDVLEVMGGDASKVVRTLKACNQDAIAKPVIELKVKMGMDNTTKDVSNSWRIVIVVDHDSVDILNKKRELCVKCRFELEWELDIQLDRHSLNDMKDATLSVVEIAFRDDMSASQRQEIRNLIKSYLSETLKSRKLFLPMLEEWASDEMGQIRKKKNQPPTQEGVLMPGEKILWADPMVQFTHHSRVGNASTSGLLFLTNYRLYFQEMGRHENQFRYELPLTCIASAVKDKKNGLDIICKDVRIARFLFSGKQRKSFLEDLMKYFPLVSSRLFAFSYFRKVHRESQDVIDKGGEFAKNHKSINGGWRLYDPMLEYNRMNLDWTKWRITALANKDYEICKSYPSILVVPKDISESEVKASARVRKDNRFPVPCWRNQDNGAVLARASVATSSLKEDEKLMASIIAASSNASKETSGPSVLRASSASQSKKRPKSTRRASAYGSAADHATKYHVIQFASGDGATATKESHSVSAISSTATALVITNTMELVSPKQLNDSFKQLVKACSGYTTEDRFLAAVDGSRWLDHIQSLLDNAIMVAEKLQQGTSTLLVEKEGCSRGLQLSSLASIMLDPYYRTMEGFIVLVEKEWLSFGHKFSDGSLLLSPPQTTETIDYQPIFLQFIDCVWQMIHQFPCAFEFNSRFLRHLMRHSLYGLYGTFICNSECDRKESLVRLFTKSFWLAVGEKQEKFYNGFFTPTPGVVIPETSSRSITLWTEYYLYWYHYTIRKAGPRKALPKPKSAEQWSHDTVQRSIVLPKLKTSMTKEQKLNAMRHYIAQLEKAKELIELELSRRPTQVEEMEEEAAEDEKVERSGEDLVGVDPALVELLKRQRRQDTQSVFGLTDISMGSTLSILHKEKIEEEDSDDDEGEVDEVAAVQLPVVMPSKRNAEGEGGGSAPSSTSTLPVIAPSATDGRRSPRRNSADERRLMLANPAGITAEGTVKAMTRSDHIATIQTMRQIKREVDPALRGSMGSLPPPSGEGATGWVTRVKPVAPGKEGEGRLSIGRTSSAPEGAGLSEQGRAAQAQDSAAEKCPEGESQATEAQAPSETGEQAPAATPAGGGETAGSSSSEQTATTAVNDDDSGAPPLPDGPPTLFYEDLPPPPPPDESAPLPAQKPPPYAPPPLY